MVDRAKQREAGVALIWNTVAAAAGANLAIATFRGLSNHLSGHTGVSLNPGDSASDAFNHCGPVSSKGGAALYVDGLCLAFGASQTLGRAGFATAHLYRLIKASLPSQQPASSVSPSAVQQSKQHRRMVWALSSIESSISCIGHLLQGEFSYQSCSPEMWPVIFNSAVASLAALTFCKGARSSIDHVRNIDMGAVQMNATGDDVERGEIKLHTENTVRDTVAGDRTLAHVLAGAGLLCWGINAYLAESNAQEQFTGLSYPSRTYTFADLPASQRIETYASFAIGALGVAQGCAIGLSAGYCLRRNRFVQKVENSLYAALQGAWALTGVGDNITMPRITPRG